MIVETAGASYPVWLVVGENGDDGKGKRIMKNEVKGMSQAKKTTELEQPEVNKVDKSGELGDEALDKVVGGAANVVNTSRSNIKNN